MLRNEGMGGIRLSKSSVQMLDIVALLLRMRRVNSALTLIFRKKSNLINGKSSLGDGWSNVPSPGSTIPDVSAKIMRFPSLLLRLWLKSPISIPYSSAYEYSFLKQMAATMSIYEESGFSSPEELEAAFAAASAELSSVHAELKAVESTLREKKDLQKQLLAYIKTKPARAGQRAQKTEKARRAYREQHESEFIISESAARYFKAQGISKLPASKALQTEIEQLTKEKNALYNEYREKKASVRELQTVKSNLDKILRREPERGKGRENER